MSDEPCELRVTLTEGKPQRVGDRIITIRRKKQSGRTKPDRLYTVTMRPAESQPSPVDIPPTEG